MLDKEKIVRDYEHLMTLSGIALTRAIIKTQYGKEISFEQALKIYEISKIAETENRRLNCAFYPDKPDTPVLWME